MKLNVIHFESNLKEKFQFQMKNVLSELWKEKNDLWTKR